MTHSLIMSRYILHKAIKQYAEKALPLINTSTHRQLWARHLNSIGNYKVINLYNDD